MSRIRILSEQLANQIAAGEVVERPASVVKELVENSLDAGADRVDVYVEGGGTGLLRVADNGEGMDSDDVLLSIERHATSKIREEGQLAAITTLGFRGEALPSIASVSWVTILSRPRDRRMGTRADIRYGVLREVHEDGCAPGTVIEIRHLFGNMPARKKFLKSRRTEMHHIEEVIKNQALAHSQVGFTLHSDGREVLAYQPETDLESRVRSIFRSSDRMLPLHGIQDSAQDGLALEGYLLLPETGAVANARLRILVNKRPVQDSMIRHAVYEGLQGFLMKGRQAAGAVLLSIGPEQVDVNVHPAKREIRFRRSDVVHRFIVEGVTQALRAYQHSLRTNLFTGSVLSPSSSLLTPQIQPQQTAQPDNASLITPRTAEPVVYEPRHLPMAPSSVPGRESSPLNPVAVTVSEVEPSLAPHSSALEEDLSGLTLIGQLFTLYLLCEKDGEFIVIDQHAAHERLLYGQLLQGYQAARISRQTLMFPATVELTPVQEETLEQRQAEVAALGLQTKYFGDSTYVISTLPALVSHVDPGSLLRETLDALRGLAPADNSRPVPRVVDDLLASMACKAAVKAGHRLQPLEMLKLLQQMEKSEIFSHCPHGRPVIKTFSVREVEKWFYRHGS
ncbi:DNA mismatch repair endonuclease MutL [Desulfobulbus alkaliphilus]|uniref:DNA mismatch repair endonuclease MutL n=1 Tax=Desulfobulbus alkaliphilus TaxID=869814 RepID=UPI0019640805|nr:DNA mismatch repair endonuclease MutL [Desulfobulbus alkaliphilus]MBM9536934.1 DNA mismatch repair endonuclease MutL [Desulfobulbus alkaliphilus]